MPHTTSSTATTVADSIVLEGKIVAEDEMRVTLQDESYIFEIPATEILTVSPTERDRYRLQIKKDAQIILRSLAPSAQPAHAMSTEDFIDDANHQGQGPSECCRCDCDKCVKCATAELDSAFEASHRFLTPVASSDPATSSSPEL